MGKTTKNELLANRLADILRRLNDGETLKVADLADEYGTSIKTIQRDIARLGFLQLEQARGEFWIDPKFLGLLKFKDIEQFAALAGLSGLFPALNKQFFRELLDSRQQETFRILGPNFEELPHNRLNDFRSLQAAIQATCKIRFAYTKESERKQVEVSPYRLTHHEGVWYLAAVNGDKPKSYAFSKISALQVLDDRFTRDPAIVAMLEKEDSIWLNTKKTEVVLSVAAPMADYFRRRKLIAQQNIVRECTDGSLLISGMFAHPNQILPTVRYWLPHVRIVSPAEWQTELEAGLHGYLSRAIRDSAQAEDA